MFQSRLQPAAGGVPQLGLCAVSLRSGGTESTATLHGRNRCLGCAVFTWLLSGPEGGHELPGQRGLPLSLSCTTCDGRCAQAKSHMPRRKAAVLGPFCLLFCFFSFGFFIFHIRRNGERCMRSLRQLKAALQLSGFFPLASHSHCFVFLGYFQNFVSKCSGMDGPSENLSRILPRESVCGQHF